MDSDNTKCEHEALAKYISRHVSSFEEVDFNKSSLVNKLAKDLKRKPDRKMRSSSKSLWTNNCTLRNEVRRILTGKVNIQSDTDCKNSGDVVEDERNVSKTTVGFSNSVIDIPVQYLDIQSTERCDIPISESVNDNSIKNCDNYCTAAVLPKQCAYSSQLPLATNEHAYASEIGVTSDKHTARTYTNKILQYIQKPDDMDDDFRYEMFTPNHSSPVENTILTNSENLKSKEYSEESDRMDDNFHYQLFSSNHSSPVRSNIAICNESYATKIHESLIVKESESASVYNFTDSDEDAVNNYEGRTPSQSREAKYNTDLGEKLVYSAKFKDSDGIVTNDRIRRGLRVVLATEYGCTCTLRFSTIRMNEEDCVAYARCMSVEHKQCFKFLIFGLRQLKASVFTVSSDKISFKHNKRSFSQLRGAERQEVKNALKMRQPRDYQMEVVRNIDPVLAADGNMQDLKKLYVYQKVKSEENCKNDATLKSADLSDLFQMWMNQDKEKDPYLRYVSLPLTAIMFTEAQLNLFEHSKGVVLHLDATGSVVRKPPYLNCKRIYYYVLVAKHNESVIPVAEMVTSEHNIKSISTFLKTYKFFVQEKLKTWPFVSAVVVDWSWAFMNSLLFEWNQMSVIEYLNMAYSFVTEGRKPKNVIIVQSCCAHFMKRMSTIIKKDYSQYERIKSFLLECIALMMLCREMKELDYVFEHFVKAVSTPDADDARSSLCALHEIVSHRRDEVKDIYNEDATESDEMETQKPSSDSKSLKKSKAIFANSPFFTHFEHKLKQVQSEIDEEKPITNKYHVPGFARHMTWKHMPFAPLWTSLMLDLVDKKISRLSNAYVESYNKVVKHQVLDHQKNVKIGHFVRKTELYTRTLLDEARLEVCLKSKEPRQKPKYPVTVTKHAVDVSQGTEYNGIPELVPDNIDKPGTQIADLTQDVVPMDFENMPLEEAADPLIGEIWKDCKKGKRARGHIEGNVLGRLLSEINKKSRKEKDIDVTHSKITQHIEDTQLTTLNCDISGESCKAMDSPLRNCNILPNGLFSDVDYYMRSKSHNVRIACFVAAHNPPIRSNCFQLTARQYHTLTPNRWLDGLVIDCYAMTHIDTWTNAMYLSTDDTGSILGANWEKRKPASCGIYNIQRELSGRIFMPYVFYGHWRLFIVDVDEQTLTLLDPYENVTTDDTRVREAFDKLLQFSDKTSTVGALRRIQWTTKTELIRPYQPVNDGSNCGVYVSHYVECLAKNKPFDLAFDPIQFRLTMARILIEKSIEVKEMCLYCFGKRYENDIAVCGVCHQWCHTHCVEKGDYDSEMEEEEDHQMMRSKKWPKHSGTLSQKKSKTTTTDSRTLFTCKLCKRSTMSISE